LGKATLAGTFLPSSFAPYIPEGIKSRKTRPLAALENGSKLLRVIQLAGIQLTRPSGFVSNRVKKCREVGTLPQKSCREILFLIVAKSLPGATQNRWV